MKKSDTNSGKIDTEFNRKINEEENADLKKNKKISGKKKIKTASDHDEAIAPERSEKKEEHSKSKDYNIPYYSRNRNDHGSGTFGGHGYTSRGGFGRRY